MTENPFSPPTAEVKDTVEEVQPPGSLWKGVLTGGVIDLGGSTLLGIIIVVLYMVFNIDAGTSLKEMVNLLEQFVEESIKFDSFWGLANVILGSTISLTAGYFCAYFAREYWLKAALVLGAIDALYVLASGMEFLPLTTNLGFGLLTFCLIMLGGWLRVLHIGEKTGSVNN